ncbi:MAG: EAL domain-containing protein [Alphaproteobacteria bacterium]|nr:EAL domain-containing protein [Alphaproteobacteria bacterium]
MIESDLHLAIARDEFVLHYQPIVDLKSGRINSVEALVRWQHPQKGMIPPFDFIPVAEESGLIVRLGEVVLEKACADAAQWPAQIRVSVNLSPIQFRDKNLPYKIAEVLRLSGLPPKRLELEITEAALLVDSADNIEILTQLRETGIRIVMDDFGTGYSSLNYLRSFPFDKIKIDRSYVKDLEKGHNQSRTILDAVVAMARGLDLSTTAEGVETQAQMDILKLAGCTEMQGYYFSKPLPRAEIEKLIESARGQAGRAA